MPISLNTVLTWCSITAAGHKDMIVGEMMSPPEGLLHFKDETTEGLITTSFRDYGCRDAADGKIVFSRVQQKQLIALKNWIKDRARLQENNKYQDDTTRAEFIAAIAEASERKECRSNQKKVGESLTTAAFQVQLETANQWDCWIIKLESNVDDHMSKRDCTVLRKQSEKKMHRT